MPLTAAGPKPAIVNHEAHGRQLTAHGGEEFEEAHARLVTGVRDQAWEYVPGEKMSSFIMQDPRP